MTRTQALQEARRRWGETAAIRDYGPKGASRPQARAEAHTAYKAMPNTAANRRQSDALFSASHRMRYTVGYVALGMFFMVEGRGDSWQEAFNSAKES